MSKEEKIIKMKPISAAVSALLLFMMFIGEPMLGKIPLIGLLAKLILLLALFASPVIIVYCGVGCIIKSALRFGNTVRRICPFFPLDLLLGAIAVSAILVLGFFFSVIPISLEYNRITKGM